MHDFAEIVAANSTAFLDVTGAVIGNPTEGALLEWLHAQGEDYEPLRAGAKIVDRLTFSTERKYMATIIQSGISGRRIVCVKGAPEIVRAMCAPDWERRAGGGTAARVPGAGDAYAGRGMGRDGRGRLPAGCRRGAASFCGCGGYFRPRARGCPRSRRALPEGGDRRQDRHGRHPGLRRARSPARSACGTTPGIPTATT